MECFECPDCGVWTPVDEWELLESGDNPDCEGYVDDNGDFHEFDVESRYRCPNCGSASDHFA